MKEGRTDEGGLLRSLTRGAGQEITVTATARRPLCRRDRRAPQIEIREISRERLGRRRAVAARQDRQQLLVRRAREAALQEQARENVSPPRRQRAAFEAVRHLVSSRPPGPPRGRADGTAT